MLRRPWPTPIWSLGCSTSAPWTGSRHRCLSPPRTCQLGPCPFAGRQFRPSAGRSSRPCRASARSSHRKRMSTSAGGSSSQDTGSPWRPTLQWNSANAAGVRPMFHAAWAYGQCGPRLYGRYRGSTACGANLRGAGKAWVLLVVASPGLVNPKRRRQWVRTFGIRAGRLASSARERVFFP